MLVLIRSVVLVSNYCTIIVLVLVIMSVNNNSFSYNYFSNYKYYFRF